MSEKPKILFIVEGADTEPRIFKALALKLGLDVSIFEVRTNIYSLYQTLKKDNFQLDVKNVLKTMCVSQNNRQAECILDDVYQAIYLVFDCDAQDSYKHRLRLPFLFRSKVLNNLKIIKEMLEYFNDEYDSTKGLLLINYPMIESFADSNACYMQEFQSRMVDIGDLRKYKKIARKQIQSHMKVSRYERADFIDVIARNARKAYWLTSGTWEIPSQEVYLKTVSQESILLCQIDNVKKHRQISVVNTSILMPLETFRDVLGRFNLFTTPTLGKMISIVVLPHLRTLKTLRKIIKSISQQSYINIELLLLGVDVAFEPYVVAEDVPYSIRVLKGPLYDERSIIEKVADAAMGEYVYFYDPFEKLSQFALVTLKGLIEVYPDFDVISTRCVITLGYQSDKKWPSLIAPKLVDLTKCSSDKFKRMSRDQHLDLHRLMMKTEAIRAIKGKSSTGDLKNDIIKSVKRIVITDCSVSMIFVFSWNGLRFVTRRLRALIVNRVVGKWRKMSII